ncbi:GDSL-type esterase/lipase family protein [Lacipirellula sp.]|uniref:GDSL-type esterase/lipase family protein n=1 Tax=Lacipirellula sp. TaxID=2691419 RepID=UPI003D136399
MLIVCIAIALSLLTFPAAIPWMIAAWLALHTWAAWNGRPSWAPLVIAFTVVAAKRPDWSVSLLTLMATMGGVVAAGWLHAWRSPLSRRSIVWGSTALLWAAWAWFAWDYAAASHVSRRLALSDRPVVCMGDSLTAFGYPKLLAERLAVPVIDLSVSGSSTVDSLKLLGRMREARPQTVVIELGGHDFLQGSSRDATADNLRQLIDAAEAVGANVLLVEIPRGFIVDWFDGLERELAREYDLELISDTAIRQLVLWSSSMPPGTWVDVSARLSDDGLHPNARGNAYLAECVAAALAKMYGPQILK